jgi:very-short-patch-repair endonuclease
MLPYNKKLKALSQKLRSSMTDAEFALWLKLRRKQLRGLQFYRQKPLGSFIVDFYCPIARLVIEIDGGQHYEVDGRNRDGLRDGYLQSLGLCVLRFSNLDVLKNIDGVIAAINEYLETVFDQVKTNS